MVQYLHHDPFFVQNKASAYLYPKTDPVYPYLKFYEKNFGVIIFLITWPELLPVRHQNLIL